MKRVLTLILLVFSLTFSSAQQQEDVKVGLVLSGGGAKGLAHIGVLEEIEKAGVRIDYIGGTSMGAIIGGLYAAGYTAKELDSIFKVIDFDELIQDNLPRAAKTFYEKNDSEKYAISLPFDGFKISFPTSLSKGQNLFNLLSKLTEHVSDVDDFSMLPTPFFCIATNVETGASVMLNKGYLPQAMSASGALPSLFSPLEINGQLLIDGGVTNNYPIQEVKKMGADVIIGIDVQDSLLTREGLKSAIDVLVQINNYRTIKDMKTKSKLTDIYIHPDIKNFSVISFDKGNEIIEAGRKEAKLYSEELKALAARQISTERKIVKKPKSDSLKIDDVDISGNKNYTRAYILGKLKLKTPINTTYQKFSEGINNLTATGNFNQINYFLKENQDEENILELQLSETKSRTLLRLGIHYDDLYKSAALINITQKRLLQKNDIASLDLILGDNIRYNFNYYIDKGFYWSVGVRSRYNNFKKNVPFELFPPEIVDGINSVANIEVRHEDFTNQFYVQTLFQQIFSLGLGAEHKYLLFKSNTLQNTNQNNNGIFEDTNYYSAYGYLVLDSRDNKYFPKKGILFDGNFNFYAFATGLNDSSFDQFSIAKATIGYTFSPFSNLSLSLTSEGGFKIGGEGTSTLDFFVGGYGFQPVNNFIHMYGYDAFSFRGDTFLKSTLRMDYQFYKKTYVSAVANIANVGDKLFESTAWIDSIPHRGYALGLASESFIGPIEVFYSYSTEIKQSNWYVSLGFWF
ncbi:patatin-like phospholipase family protein [Planktosalinus lacus]|uniref:Patatin n=1 Tax=Planktosalinus lacus TaxID=1526573 RepID=A0A8J2YB18_9FLAO|nr:patatin-like phospholipase family protein [Planktosalinus lacus]GGD95728.1 patatin [Planktosalinus lacus]